ncbi:Sodium/hydrogen exchanger 8 [Dermatophagoides pteronyssinus]|uniref:Sodium/hydrogen exchanger n=1 Tax=Dermatophagoides pteronyssinus TaxID=6956 RepID=A0ABQ8JQE0_DERPT|nr:Sodium/hydrogen exchanger 8 [Dermatophagoides pteronyssinus]
MLKKSLLLLILFIYYVHSINCDETNSNEILSQSPSSLIQNLSKTPLSSSSSQTTTIVPIATTITSINNLSLINSSTIISNSTLQIPTTLIPGLNDSIVATTENSTQNNATSTSQQTPSTQSSSIDPNLPHKGAAEEERHSSMAIFFVLSVIASCIFLIHFILKTKFQYIPESLAVVFLGAAIGLVMKMSSQNLGDWKKEETLSPTMFFLILLPPIIYESGYTLHKGNFFQNIGSILVFAIIGTSISAFIIGGGIYILGAINLVYRLSFTESFAFGSLISAVDPVATLAIFHALNLDPILNMLVFGESILNDAVAIVLATTALELNHLDDTVSGSAAIFNGFVRFFIVFFGSAFIGASFALLAALVFKYIDLRKHPSLEFGMMLILIYAPYGLAEGLHLSGIMAILFNGVVMSHYAHFNLSPVTQITMQQTLRTLAFIAETCVFAYLGLAIFSFKMKIEWSLIIWSILLCLIGRALNIYPLSYLVNYFREHKISRKMMFVMWFSGLRGAIAYALALHLAFEEEKRRVIVTTTLIIVLFTIIILGSSTMPVLKYMNRNKHQQRINRKGRRCRRRGGISKSKSNNRLITLSKTQEMGQAIETEHLSELTEEELEVSYRNESNLKGFVRFDARYLMPLFTRIFTDQEVKDCKSQMTDLTNRWYQTVRRPSESDEDDDDDERDNLYDYTDDGDDDDDLFDENKNHNRYFIDIDGDDDDDGIFADVEEGSVGRKHKKHHHQQQRHQQNNVNSEKQSLCNKDNNSNKKHLFKKESSNRSTTTTNQGKKSNQKLFQKTKLMLINHNNNNNNQKNRKHYHGFHNADDDDDDNQQNGSILT